MSLVFCIDYRRIKRINEVQPTHFAGTSKFINPWMYIIDTAICAQTLCLVAEALGLKSVYIGNILNNVDKVTALFKLPDYVLPSIMVTLGYPKSSAKISGKYGINVLVHDEEYRDMDIDELFAEYRKKYRDWSMKANGKNIGALYNTAIAYHGKAYAELCRKYVIDKKFISPYQYWFGCYYLNEVGFMGFREYQNFMERKGFNWMK